MCRHWKFLRNGMGKMEKDIGMERKKSKERRRNGKGVEKKKERNGKKGRAEEGRKKI